MGGIGMVPPFSAAGQAVMLADQFGVPVIVRRSSPLTPKRRPGRKRIDRARQPWPSTGTVPPNGDYLVTTTWRDVLDAAMTVGRDPYPWLTAVPQFAAAEIIARRSPLSAYLHRVPIDPGPDFQLEPNVVYQEGTEKTARALFGYRIGMTMAEWACRGLMGLDSTIHAESLPKLPGRGPAWDPQLSQPDLVGYQAPSLRPRLIEAKGARRLGLKKLREGAEQLTVPGLMKIPHTRVLCGTSIEHRIFMTIDVDDSDADYLESAGPGSAGRRRGPGNNNDALVGLARSRMLMFHTLRALPRASLAIRPVGTAVRESQSSQAGTAGLVMPLENDESTAAERERARDRAGYERRPGRLDMLTGRIPETGMTIGMSRGLYEACRGLADAEAELWEAAEADVPVSGRIGDLDDVEAEYYLMERQGRFADREERERQELYRVA